MGRGRTSVTRSTNNPCCPWCGSSETRVSHTKADKYVMFEGEEIRPPRRKFYCQDCGGPFDEIRIVSKIQRRETAVKQ